MTRTERIRGLLLVVLAALALTLHGCASPHLIVLQDGTTIETTDEPEFDEDEGFYRFENAAGKKVRLNRDEVQRIEQK